MIFSSSGKTPWPCSGPWKREKAGKGKGFWEAWKEVPGIFIEDLPIDTTGLETGPLWSLSGIENQEISRLIREQPSSKESLQKLASFLSAWKEMGQEIWLVVSQDSQAKRLRDILSFYQLEVAYFPGQRHQFDGQTPGVQILTGRLSAGFRMKASFADFFDRRGDL